jgi:hypothetical protein
LDLDACGFKAVVGYSMVGLFCYDCTAWCGQSP